MALLPGRQAAIGEPLPSSLHPLINHTCHPTPRPRHCPPPPVSGCTHSNTTVSPRLYGQIGICRALQKTNKNLIFQCCQGTRPHDTGVTAGSQYSPPIFLQIPPRREASGVAATSSRLTRVCKYDPSTALSTPWTSTQQFFHRWEAPHGSRCLARLLTLQSRWRSMDAAPPFFYLSHPRPSRRWWKTGT